jgi:hypothetical protein
VGKIGGSCAGEEIAVGILSGRQLHDVSGDAGAGEPLREGVGGALAGLVLVLIEDHIDRAARLTGKLIELSGGQVGADGASGIAKARLPEHSQVE